MHSSHSRNKLRTLPTVLAPLLLWVTIFAFGPLLSVSVASERRGLEEADEFRGQLNQWVETTLNELDAVPSLSVAVVVEDELIVAEGWGLADRESQVSSSGETLYYIASATKPFTALAAAILDYEGTIDLDASVKSQLNHASMGPSIDAAKVKLRDLLTHTSGIENEPLVIRLAYTGQHDPNMLAGLLAESKAREDAPLGTFGYANVGYNIYTVLSDQTLGTRWQDLLQRDVLDPLGMSRTTAYASRPRNKGWEVAAPYLGIAPEGIRRLYLEKQDNTMQSAGGVLSSAKDLARWLEFQMNEGVVDERQVIPAEVVRQTHQKWAEVPKARPPFGGSHYGLGWYHGEYLGERVLHHSGGFAGFRTLVAFMPDKKVGVAINVNEASIGSRLVDKVGQWIFEWWLHESTAETEESVQQFAAQQAPLRQRMKDQKEEHGARQWMLSRPRPQYAGTYVNDVWGTIRVADGPEGLTMEVGNLHCVATAYEKPETMRIELVPGQGQVAEFRPASGRPDTLRMNSQIYIRR